MNIADTWANLERDQAWREQEIRFLEGRLVEIPLEGDQELFRRSIIVMLYAHFEGFCKLAFLTYITAINAESIKCAEANYAIAAASLNDVFAELRDPSTKCPEFRNSLPDDTKLHRFARDREFVERSQEITSKLVTIPDSIVDTEDNLKPIVLRKLLFRLGFQHDGLKNVEGSIHQLLEARNTIAHGVSTRGIDEKSYDRLKGAAYTVMNEVRRTVMLSLLNQDYLRK